MTADDVAIKVENISKSFKLPHEKQDSVKGIFVNLFNRKKTYEKQEVLKDVSFEIKKGEFFGIVGRNGSGKSTLLKVLAGIYEPNKGAVHVSGKLTPFIELGVGFNPNLTGRENVFLNGALLGFNRKEMNVMYQDIVDFAEIHKFMDQKLKNYSSGMQVRLAFSIAIRAKSDILLFDEVLAVGDAAFQQKCYATFDRLHAEGRTIVLVTHDMSAVQRFCKKAILIDKGNIMFSGDPSSIADRYLEQNLNESSSDNPKDVNLDVSEMTIRQPSLLTIDGKNRKSFGLNEKMKLKFKFENKSKHSKIQIGLQIFSGNGTYCFGTNTRIASQNPITSTSADIEVTLDQSFVPGTYYITLAAMNEGATTIYKYVPKVITFNVKQESEVQGVMLMKYEWRIKQDV